MQYNKQTKILYGGPNHKAMQDIGFGELLFQKLVNGGNKTALIDATSEAVLTFNQVRSQATIFVNTFYKLGLQKGDSVLFYCNNRLEYLVPIVAALYNGIIVAPINYDYIKDELVHTISITKAKVVFCSEANIDDLLVVLPKCKFIKHIIVFDYLNVNPSFDTFYSERALRADVKIHSYTNLLSQFTFKQVNLPAPEKLDFANDIAFVFCSSGTTGLPKGVMLTHKNITAGYILFNDPLVYRPEAISVVIIFLPLFHAFGNQVGLYGLLENTESIIMAKFNEERFYQLIEKYKVTLNYVVPPLCVLISKSEIAKKYDLSSLHTFVSGAAPLSAEVELAVQEKIKLPYVRQGYGMTETTLGVIVTPYEKISGKDGTVGVILPGMWVKVVNINTGEALGPNCEGEICMKGDMIMKGYFGNPKATAETIDKDGWLHSGDIGYYDDDYYFFIVDRLKELIKCKGFQVAPAELEALILTHPKVQDVGVVGIPDDMSGEIPCAFVLKKDNVNVSEKEIINYVAERVSRQKHLGRVVFINEIPKNPSGKILRRKLRELITTLKSSL